MKGEILFLLLLVVSLSIFGVECKKKKDPVSYYDILMVDKKASFGEIKRAYKKMAIINHPDKSEEDPEVAQEKFMEISHAYQVLSDEEKRTRYDQLMALGQYVYEEKDFPTRDSSTPEQTETERRAHQFKDAKKVFEEFKDDEPSKIPTIIAVMVLIGVAGFGYTHFLEQRREEAARKEAQRLKEEKSLQIRMKEIENEEKFYKNQENSIKRAAKMAGQYVEADWNKVEEVDIETFGVNEPVVPQKEEKAEEEGDENKEGNEEEKEEAPKKEVVKKQKAKDGQKYDCTYCKKEFKTDSQWKNHEQSKKHLDNVKAANRGSGKKEKEDKDTTLTQRVPKSKKKDQSHELNEDEIAALMENQ